MSHRDPGWPFRDDVQLPPRVADAKRNRELRAATPHRRWTRGRIRRTSGVPWGYYKIDGPEWTVWSWVFGRFEHYVARRCAPKTRRFP